MALREIALNQKKLLLGIIAVFIILTSYIFLITSSPTTINYAEKSAILKEGILPREPVRLVIDAIGVDALVQQVGLTKEGRMGIPTNFTDVAWYNGGPRPGVSGSAVIAGHLDGIKTPKAVFYDIDKLVVGDVVEVEDVSGRLWKFKVVGKKIYDYTASTEEIFLGDTSKSRLNLITCDGDWIKSQKLYDKRLVVFTELASSQ